MSHRERATETSNWVPAPAYSSSSFHSLSIRHTQHRTETDTRWLPLSSSRPPYSPNHLLLPRTRTRSLRTPFALTVLETPHPRQPPRRPQRLHNSRHGFHHQLLQAQRHNPCSRKTSTSIRAPRHPTVGLHLSIRRCILRLTAPPQPSSLGT